MPSDYLPPDTPSTKDVIQYSQMSARDLALCSQEEGRASVPFTTAVKFSFLPLGLIDLGFKKLLTIAVANENDIEHIHAIRFATGLDIKAIEVDEKLLKEAIFLAYKSDASSLAKASSELPEESSNTFDPLLSASLSGPAQFLQTLVEYAVSQTASDIHITPQEQGCIVRLRIQGKLVTQEIPGYSHAGHQAVINRLLVLSRVPVDSRSNGVDCSFHLSLPYGSLTIRVSVLPTIYGEKVVLRLPTHSSLPTISELGLSPLALSLTNNTLHNPEGTLVFCGPTGSGKSTSMYSLLDRLNQGNVNISTIEDPVERAFKGISQTCVEEKRGLSFAECLRKVLRQDPDIILLGEVRDTETAEVAFQASLTGHLILTTIHGRTVFEALLRLSHLGIDRLTLAQSLSGVICQRLLPKLCQKCKVIDLKSSTALGVTIFQAVGCNACDHTGYYDRLLIDQTLRMENELQRMIVEKGFDTREIQSVVNEANYSPFSISLEKALRKGQIDVQTAKEFLPSIR